jgi:hypothetical protein
LPSDFDIDADMPFNAGDRIDGDALRHVCLSLECGREVAKRRTARMNGAAVSERKRGRREADWMES